MGETDVSELRKIDMFAGLAAAQLEQLASFARAREVQANETVFRQGDPSSEFYGVLSGEVVVQRDVAHRQLPPKVVGVVGPGALFGESAFFADTPRNATAVARHPTRLILFPGQRLRQWLANQPNEGMAFVLGMLQTSLGRLGRTSHELSIVCGVSRLLGTARGMQERLAASLEFVHDSLMGVEALALYQRSAYWEEFAPLVVLPSGIPAPTLPLSHAMCQEALAAAAPTMFRTPSQRQAADQMPAPWNQADNILMLPLWDRDQTPAPMQGWLLLRIEAGDSTLASNLMLCLSAVAESLGEALSRHNREQDAIARSRLQQSRHAYPG